MDTYIDIRIAFINKQKQDRRGEAVDRESPPPFDLDRLYYYKYVVLRTNVVQARSKLPTNNFIDRHQQASVRRYYFTLFLTNYTS